MTDKNGIVAHYKDLFEETLVRSRTLLQAKQIITFGTITLKPKMYKYQSLTQYEITYPELRTVIERTKMRLCEVVAELTQTGNIHYHFVLIVSDKSDKISFINRLKKNRTFGYIHISPEITHDEGLKRALVYMYKDVDTTRKVLHTSNYKPEIIQLFL